MWNIHYMEYIRFASTWIDWFLPLSFLWWLLISHQNVQPSRKKMSSIHVYNVYSHVFSQFSNNLALNWNHSRRHHHYLGEWCKAYDADAAVILLNVMETNVLNIFNWNLLFCVCIYKVVRYKVLSRKISSNSW